MGYFSNGTEGAWYEELYCEKCVHDDCAVLGLHYAYNYSEANKKDSFLHELIPYKDGLNGKCNMFHQKIDQPQEITLLLKDNADLRAQLEAIKAENSKLSLEAATAENWQKKYVSTKLAFEMANERAQAAEGRAEEAEQQVEDLVEQCCRYDIPVTP